MRDFGSIFNNNFSAREVTKNLSKEAWSRSFNHVKSIPVSANRGEEMIREFCLFINGFCIVASSSQVELRSVRPEELSQVWSKFFEIKTVV